MLITLSFNSLLWLAGISNTVAGVPITYLLRKHKTLRTRNLWKFIVFHIFLFPGVVYLSLLIESPETFLDYLSHILYSFIFSYVVTIEIPGYLSFSGFDEKAHDSLEKIRNMIIGTIVSYDRILELREESVKSSSLLEYIDLKDLVNGLVDSSSRIGTSDPTLSALLLSEITREIDSIDTQSKHPFPKLIDLLSLAGLSFLIAQILKAI